MSISLFLCSMLILGLMSTLPICLYLMMHNTMIYLEWQFFYLTSSSMNLSLIFDKYGVFFSCVVMLISLNVFMFSEVYMKGEVNMIRFSYLVLLFILSMNMLIYIPNMISLLLGWDGLGLTSFLLVIYYQNKKSLGAGMITALTNRIGDALILVSIGFMLTQGHWLITVNWVSFENLALILSIMMAAMTKSAQVPFSSWLPAAMAAPTPVSALVHSSTLVTAGVFLLFRFYNFLSKSPMFCWSLLFFAVLTSLMAGMSAMTECDMKKIIALSTLSQLGVMMVGLGLGAPLFTYFHLITHALFKALLFICAGSLIHLHSHSQDLRFMGNISLQSPFISACLVVSNLALCGGPFMAGFYSKDLILEMCFFDYNSLLMVFLFYFATGLTSAYTVRFLISVVWSPNNSTSLHSVGDGEKVLMIPMFILSFMSVCGGAVINWLMLIDMCDMFLPVMLKLMVIYVTVFGVIFSWTGNLGLFSLNSLMMMNPMWNYSMCLMWFLSPLSSQKMIQGPLWMGHMMLKSLDQGWEEMISGKGAISVMEKSSSGTQLMQASVPMRYFFFSFFIMIFIMMY